MTAVPISYETMKKAINPWLWKNKRANYLDMGSTAENVAAKCNITREEMDAFAVESHKKAAAAQDAGHLAASIIPLDGIDPEGNPIVFDQDQGIRRGTTMESLASLQPCFKKDGVVTAATSSQTSDGAGFVVLTCIFLCKKDE